jgi:hypothetical protein
MALHTLCQRVSLVRARDPRDHDAPVHADVRASIVDVSGVVGDDVFEDEHGLGGQRVSRAGIGTAGRVHTHG